MEFCQLQSSEQTKLYPLLGKCFACWAKYGAGDPFPFEMTSFVAVENGRFAAHCGIVKMTISDGGGGRIALGGLANVCTDSDFRHQGLAEKLCRMAIDWAKREKLAGIPLFTSFEKVYQKNGWRNYPIFMPKRAKWRDAGNPKMLTKGDALPPEARQTIMALYQRGFDFPGKVERAGETSFSLFSWRHHFARFEFAADASRYAAGGGNVVCEIMGEVQDSETFLLSLPRENGETILILPENSPFWAKISELADLKRSDIFFHGPMVLDLDERQFFQRHNFYFPLTDRF